MEGFRLFVYALDFTILDLSDSLTTLLGKKFWCWKHQFQQQQQKKLELLCWLNQDKRLGELEYSSCQFLSVLGLNLLQVYRFVYRFTQKQFDICIRNATVNLVHFKLDTLQNQCFFLLLLFLIPDLWSSISIVLCLESKQNYINWAM